MFIPIKVIFANRNRRKRLRRKRAQNLCASLEKVLPNAPTPIPSQPSMEESIAHLSLKPQWMKPKKETSQPEAKPCKQVVNESSIQISSAQSAVRKSSLLAINAVIEVSLFVAFHIV